MLVLTRYLLLILSLFPCNRVSASESCWKNITSWHGAFHSPNYPRNYSPNLDCYWLITVSIGNTIAMTINDLSVEPYLGCQKDFIEVYDGPTKSSPMINTRLCGKSLGSEQRSMISGKNVMLVHMHSDRRGEYRGFNASYQGVCHLNITSPHGEISSPHFPGLHTGEASCNWLIDKGGYYITIHFSEVLSSNNTAGCKSNYIQIQEGHSFHYTILTICGEVNTTTITSKSPMRILYAKERNQTFEFKAHYTAKDINECSDRTHGVFPCHQNASCINNNGSFTCECKEGYIGDGKNCSDINECVMQSPCHANAQCINTNGSFICECHKGYGGNGRYCHDINECMEKTHTCQPGTICINKEGLYTCPCRDGFFFDRDTTKCLPDVVVLNQPEENDQWISPEVIAGIVMTVILFLAVSVIGGLFYWKKYKRENTYVSEEQDASKYGRNPNAMIVSRSYDLCNISLTSMASGPKRSLDAATADLHEHPARLNLGDVENYGEDTVMKPHNRHEMAPRNTIPFQIFDDQLESIEV